MYIDELTDSICEDNNDIERMVRAHNLGDVNALNALPQDIIGQVQATLRAQFGDTITLYHGSDVEITSDLIWRENSSFTDEFDVEFAGEDGWIVEAQVPVERIKFFLNSENEFVISAGALNCTVYTVAEYFGL